MSPGGDIRLGTSGWSYPDWIGSFYPAGLPSGEMLRHITQRFRAVEVDSTFYRVPSHQMINRWREIAPPGFQFALKMTKTVTHGPHGPEAHEDLDAFCEAARGLGKHLGPILLQFPASFRGDWGRKALMEFLPRLPLDLRWAVEFRSTSLMKAALFDLLREYGVALCITDLVRLPRPTVITATFSYVRLLGNRKALEGVAFDRVHLDRDKDNASWAERIQQIAEQADPVFAFFNNHWSGHSPADVSAMSSLLGQRLPAPPPSQPDLFA